jgi:SynChlorMet cassette protein ScmC
MNLSCSENGYHLQLADGQEWHIVAARGTRSIVERMALIMQLRTCKDQGATKLIFKLWESSDETKWDTTYDLDPEVQRDFPRNGWKAHYPAILRFLTHHSVSHVICEIKVVENRIDDKAGIGEIAVIQHALDPIYHRAQQLGGLPFHAALVGWNGMGILLAGQGGSGKSTCCSRLPSDWRVLSDDETLVVQAREEYIAHPFPTWSDFYRPPYQQTWDTLQHLQLRGIFFLEQAEFDKVVPIGQGQAALFINESASQVGNRIWKKLCSNEKKAYRKRQLDNACRLAKVVPAFILCVSLTGRFWEEIEKVLSQLQDGVNVKVASQS